MTPDHTTGHVAARSRPSDRARRRPVNALRATFATIAALSIAGAGPACGESEPFKEGAEPDPAAGEQVYKDFCGSCHGRDFEGSSNGPSHLDAVYAPESTTDDDFRRAIAEGAPEVHYDFGSMPAIASLDGQEVEDMIAYVRQVQEERGLND